MKLGGQQKTRVKHRAENKESSRNTTTGENPVGGATGVQCTRRSADGKVQRRELASIRDREFDLGQVLTR